MPLSLSLTVTVPVRPGHGPLIRLGLFWSLPPVPRPLQGHGRYSRGSLPAGHLPTATLWSGSRVQLPPPQLPAWLGPWGLVWGTPAPAQRPVGQGSPEFSCGLGLGLLF